MNKAVFLFNILIILVSEFIFPITETKIRASLKSGVIFTSEIVTRESNSDWSFMAIMSLMAFFKVILILSDLLLK